MRTIGGAGSGAGQLKNPEGVAVDGAGNVFVSDAWGSSSIVVFCAAREGGPHHDAAERGCRLESGQQQRHFSLLPVQGQVIHVNNPERRDGGDCQAHCDWALKDEMIKAL